ncbi:MAG: LysR family transcriptional regulator, partial [Clostridia bacterium]|nr:LysR family transcriptional regulator [Clostridia bacterium]
FYHVAQFESISKASEFLYITQPAVSRVIRQLEESLSCPLFFRTSKGVKLTKEGDILYRYIQQAFNFISMGEKKMAEVTELLCGEITIGVSDTLCKHYLMPYLRLFKTLYPKIKIHVVCPTTPGIVNFLKVGKIDFGIVNLPYDDEQLEFKTIMDVQDCFVTGEAYKHLSFKMQPLEEIVKHPLMLLERNSHSRILMDAYFKSHNVEAEPDFELGNMDLLAHFARNGFGVACVIRDFIQDELEKGLLYEVKPIEKIPPRSIGISFLKGVPLSPAAKELIRQLDDLNPEEF